MIKIIAFARALAHAGKNRQSRVLGRNVIDQFEHVHGLADASAAE